MRSTTAAWLCLRAFNDGPQSNDPTTQADAGDGYLFRRGYRRLVRLDWRSSCPETANFSSRGRRAARDFHRLELAGPHCRRRRNAGRIDGVDDFIPALARVNAWSRGDPRLSIERYGTFEMPSALRRRVRAPRRATPDAQEDADRHPGSWPASFHGSTEIIGPAMTPPDDEFRAE